MDREKMIEALEAKSTGSRMVEDVSICIKHDKIFRGAKVVSLDDLLKYNVRIMIVEGENDSSMVESAIEAADPLLMIHESRNVPNISALKIQVNSSEMLHKLGKLDEIVNNNKIQ